MTSTPSPAIDAATEIYERIGRLNLLSLRAHTLIYDVTSLSFAIGANRRRRVRITLTAGDRYDVELFQLEPRTFDVRTLRRRVDVVADQLAETVFDVVLDTYCPGCGADPGQQCSQACPANWTES